VKITDIDLVDVEDSLVTPNPWRAGLPRNAARDTTGYLRIRTDEGLTGYSVAHRARFVQEAVDRHLRDELVGQDPLQREYLWRRVWELNRLEFYPPNFLGVVDIALWDLAGKAAGLPVHQLLGGFRDELPAYASTVTFDSIDEYLGVADQCLQLGYHGLKLHAWGDARRDAALSLAMRAHVGPDVPLMFDASGGFDLPDAIYLGRALTEAGFLWYEEPMREFNITSHRWLADAVGVPLLVAEITEGAHQNTADFIAAGCAAFVRTSAGFKAGITGAMRIAHLAEAFHLRAEVHGPGLPNEHLCMAIPNTTYYESLVTNSTVVQDPRLTDRQMLPAPTAPGVGFPLDAIESVPVGHAKAADSPPPPR
jgi:L-alanine-DL-glutamate epimerase-like enolase superfamily enzyme